MNGLSSRVTRSVLNTCHNTTKDYAITEVFKMESGVTCNVRNVAQVNATPRDLYAGQIVPMQIASISKNGVMFDNIGTKQNIQSSVNLFGSMRSSVTSFLRMTSM